MAATQPKHRNYVFDSTDPPTPPPSSHSACPQVTWDESGDPPPVEPETLRACIPRDLRDRLVAAVREVAESPDAALFAEPVDVEDYPNVIPVPMDLGLVVRRLEKVRGANARARVD